MSLSVDAHVGRRRLRVRRRLFTAAPVTPLHHLEEAERDEQD
jgi:hypothetical protein